MKFLSNLNYDWKIIRDCAPAAQIHVVPCFGTGLPQIIAVRKYFVDTMRKYAIWLLTSPHVMCKYNQMITNIAAIYVYYVRYNLKLFVSRNFQTPLS